MQRGDLWEIEKRPSCSPSLWGSLVEKCHAALQLTPTRLAGSRLGPGLGRRRFNEGDIFRFPASDRGRIAVALGGRKRGRKINGNFLSCRLLETTLMRMAG